jgi:hypothetical protein
MSKFIIKCDCGEEAILKGYKFTGSLNDHLLSVDIEVNEDNHEDVTVNFNCENCGNHFYISKS